jgi:hypothetical protein
MRDAMGVSGRSVSNRADERLDAHGQAVWSWSPGAEIKFAPTMVRMTGARQPVPGESAE